MVQRQIVHGYGRNAQWDAVLAQGDEQADAVRADDELRAALVEAVQVLSEKDYDVLAAAGGYEYAQQVLAVVGSSMDVRFLKGRMGRIAKPKLSRYVESGPLEISELLVLPVLTPVAEEVLGERFDEPNEDDIRALAVSIDEQFGEKLCQLYLLAVAGGGADGAPAARTVAMERVVTG